MTEDNPDKQDKSYQNRLYPEDQAKVDEFVKRGINSVQRKPFRPMRLLLLLLMLKKAQDWLSLRH